MGRAGVRKMADFADRTAVPSLGGITMPVSSFVGGVPGLPGLTIAREPSKGSTGLV